MIAYWLAQLRPTAFAFFITSLASTLIMNVSSACGCFFSAAFNSVPLAMAYLVPFDYILMVTSGVFIKLDTLPQYLAWTPFMNWMMYGNEVMSGVQWEGVTNISMVDSSNAWIFNYFRLILACVRALSSELPCYQTGEEVLEHYNFSSGHIFLNLTIMCLLYILFHLLGYLCMCRRSKRT